MDELIKALGISGPTLLAQVINFGILFLLLYLLAYKPVMRMLDERSRKVQESVEQAERISEQADNAEEEAKKRIQSASQEGQELIARATRAGEEARQKAQQEAREEADSIISRARAEIQRERDDAIDALRQEVADISIMAAEKVIEKSLDKEAHRELIDKTLEDSNILKKG